MGREEEKGRGRRREEKMLYERERERAGREYTSLTDISQASLELPKQARMTLNYGVLRFEAWGAIVGLFMQ